MAGKDLWASLDVGTGSTRCVIAERGTHGEISVVGHASRPSQGMRRGMIVDVEACATAIRDAFSRAERMAGGSASSVYVGLSPLYATLHSSRGIVAILGENHEVSEDDISRVIEATKMAQLPPNREILDVLSKEYIIDGYGGLRDPRKMVGMRLELEASLLMGNLTAVANLQRAVSQAGYKVAGLVLKPMALGHLVLNDEECELGVALIAIGAFTSEIGYFSQGLLRQVGVVPLGGAHVTNDLAVGLKVSLAVAEKIKTELDLSGAGDSPETAVELSNLGHIESKRVSLRTIAEIADARLEEILTLALRKSLAMTDKQGVPTLVVTGGMANTKGFKTIMKRYLPGATRLSVGTHGYVDDPGFNTAVGILSSVLASSRSTSESVQSDQPGAGGAISRLAGWLRDFWE